MYNLVNIQGSLQSFLCLGVSICFSPENAVLSTCCRVLSFNMICVNLHFRQVFNCVQVLSLNCLIFWPLASFFSFLIALVLHTHSDSFRKSYWRTSTFPWFSEFPHTSQTACCHTAFSHPKEKLSLRHGQHIGHCFHNRLEQFSVFSATSLVYNELAGSFHYDCCPASGL